MNLLKFCPLYLYVNFNQRIFFINLGFEISYFYSCLAILYKHANVLDVNRSYIGTQYFSPLPSKLQLVCNTVTAIKMMGYWIVIKTFVSLQCSTTTHLFLVIIHASLFWYSMVTFELFSCCPLY